MSLEHALSQIERWDVDHAVVAVVDDSGIVASRGDLDFVYPIASITKLLSAYGVLVAVEEGTTTLEEPLGPEGSSIAHLLSHASGLSPSDRHKALVPPNSRRIYSNAAYDLLSDHVASRASMPFDAYVGTGVIEPLEMLNTELGASAAYTARSNARDLARFLGELLSPTLLDPSTVARATKVSFPGIPGVLPGFGSQHPCDWGLGFERRSTKSPHWTGESNTPETFGHFGQSGTFVWVDPVPRLGVVVLTDRGFDDWAKTAWPEISDAILRGYAVSATH